MKAYRYFILVLSTIFLIASMTWITKLYNSLDRSSFHAISGTQENYSWAVAKLTMSIADFKSVIAEEENSNNFDKEKISDQLDLVFSRIFVLSDNVESTKYLILQNGYTETIVKMNGYLSLIDDDFKTQNKVTKTMRLLAEKLREESNKIANFADHAETYQRTLALNDFLKKRDTLRHLLIVTWLLTITMTICTLLYIKNMRKALDIEKKAVFAKNAFLAKVSHELRSSLQVILGSIDNLVDGKEQDDNEDIQRLNSSTNKILRQIKDLTDYVMIDSGAINITNSEFSINDLLRSVISDCKKIYTNPNIDIKLNIDNDFIIKSDKERLYQIIENLVSNALKYSEKGTITLTLELSKSKTLIIHVRDTGIGISKNNLQKIFTPFTRLTETISRIPGTGMGLAIVKGIVEGMGGKITVESEIGNGSLFTTSIPLQERPVEVRKSSSNLAQKNNNEFKSKLEILAVDDQNDVLAVIQKMINRMGHRCDITTSPERAIQKAMRKPYDIIITDLQMPSMSGISLANQIKSIKNMNNSTPIIIMTGYDKKDISSEIPIITKPIRSPELEIIINSLHKPYLLND